MQTKNRFLDDIAKVANTAVSAFSGVKQEIQAMVRNHLENYLSELDLVSRDEFEAVKAMAAKARLEQEAIQKRLDEMQSNAKSRSRKKRISTKRKK